MSDWQLDSTRISMTKTFSKHFNYIFCIILSFLPLLNDLRAEDLVDFSNFKTESSQTVQNTRIPKDGLRVVWWNIGCGLETDEIRVINDLNPTNLEFNLLELSSSSAKPDVLILGEYCPYYMPVDVKKKLLKLYRNNYHLERNIPLIKTSSGVNQRNGFLILSDLEIRPIVKEVLHSRIDAIESKDDRAFFLFEVTKNNRNYKINPVHLVNPWRSLYQEKGLLAVFSELTSGDMNSNAIQIKSLIAKNNNYSLKNDFYLSIGDFNSPGSVYSFSGFGYKLMSNSMTSLMPGNIPTYLGEGSFPASDIDHAFGKNLKAIYSEVWPLDGSRHLPIYLVIDAI